MLNLKITQNQMSLLGINTEEAETIRLAQHLSLEDIDSCQTVNQALVDAFSIINERIAVASAKLKRINEEAKATKRKLLRRLVTAKYEAPMKLTAEADNATARAAWEKGGKAGEFIPPHDLSRFEDISDLTTLNPSKLTDDARTSLAEGQMNEKHFSHDYHDLIEAVEILAQIKDTVVNLGRRVDTQVMAFGTLNKITSGR